MQNEESLSFHQSGGFATKIIFAHAHENGFYGGIFHWGGAVDSAIIINSIAITGNTIIFKHCNMAEFIVLIFWERPEFLLPDIPPPLPIAIFTAFIGHICACRRRHCYRHRRGRSPSRASNAGPAPHFPAKSGQIHLATERCWATGAGAGGLGRPRAASGGFGRGSGRPPAPAPV